MTKPIDGKHLQRGVVFLVGVFIIVFFDGFVILGTSLTASAAVDLEKALIQVNGLLLPFTGLVFTGTLAEVRYRSEGQFNRATRCSPTS